MNHLARWHRKFANAFRGVRAGIEGQDSFWVHLPCSAIVLGFAFILKCSSVEWAILFLCIGFVLSAELFNSSIEWLSRGLCKEENTDVGKALDIASGAVLVASIFAAFAGLAILAIRLLGYLTQANG